MARLDEGELLSGWVGGRGHYGLQHCEGGFFPSGSLIQPGVKECEELATFGKNKTVLFPGDLHLHPLPAENRQHEGQQAG